VNTLSNNGANSPPNSTKNEPDSNGTGSISLSRYKIKPLELDSSAVIARKLSGRYIGKKKESTNSLQLLPNKTTTTPATNAATTTQANSDTKIDMHGESKSSVVSETNVNFELNDSTSAINGRSSNSGGGSSENENLCAICLAIECDASNKENFYQIICGHRFCKPCWDQYLTLKIDEGAVSDIVCPQVDCFAIIPHQVVESLISKETAQR
jgi:hypothetical protein